VAHEQAEDRVALRDKLTARSRPFLPAGADVRQVFIAQVGLNPLRVKYRTVVVTREAIYVLRNFRFRMKPQELVAILPRQTQLGLVPGLSWGQVELMGEPHWVHRRFYKDVAASDAEAAMAA
jgi:hypothetical protein